MPQTLPHLLQQIGSGKVPTVILVGGDYDYTVERTFVAVRDAILAADPGMELEAYPETADLGTVLDSFRTMSLFAGKRLLVLPEVNAFVTRKEIARLYEKAATDWKSAKTDRKRSSSVAKLLHVLGLVGLDPESPDDVIAEAIGLRKADGTMAEILNAARAGGRKATRGEGDAALLAESVARGGAPGAVLLLRSGEIPADSATIALIDREGAVVISDLARSEIVETIDAAIAEIAGESGVVFEPAAIAALRGRLGIDRLLNDKFSREIPDIRTAISEAERLATFAGEGGRVTAKLVEQQVTEIAGGARYELGSLFAEKKPLEAVLKLRDLVAQSRREETRSSADIHYGRYLFAIADEVRQLIGIISWARVQKVDLRKPVSYNLFKDTLSDSLGAYLLERSLVRQRLHPFALFRKFEAARAFRESDLLETLRAIARIDYERKSGGVPAEISIETLLFEGSK